MANIVTVQNAPRDRTGLTELSGAVLFRLFIQSGALLGLSRRDSDIEESSFISAPHEGKVVLVDKALLAYDKRPGPVIDFVEQDFYASPSPSKAPL